MVLVAGDFNVIWDEEEKIGGVPVKISEVEDFRHCVNTCNLFDLGFKEASTLDGMVVQKKIVFLKDWKNA